MRCRTAVALLSLSLITVPAFAQAPGTLRGGESPQAVVAAIQKATEADDLAMAVAFIAPEARRALAKEGISGLLMALAFSDPDDAMPGSAPLAKADLEKKRKDYKTAVDLATKTLKAHGIEGVIGKPVLALATQKPINAALEKADTVALVRDMVQALESIGPLLGMTRSDRPKVPVALGKVGGYTISGDKATAKAEKETLDFVRIDGRWYLTPPAPGEG